MSDEKTPPEGTEEPLPAAEVRVVKSEDGQTVDAVEVAGPKATIRARWISFGGETEDAGRGPMSGLGIGVSRLPTAEEEASSRALKADKKGGATEVPMRRGEETPQELALALLEGSTAVIPPLVPLRTLATVRYRSTILGPCIEAMVTNIAGFGYDFDYIGPPEEPDDAAEDDGETETEVAKKPEALPPGKQPAAPPPPTVVVAPPPPKKPKPKKKPKTGEKSDAAQAELKRMQALFAGINPRRSFVALRRMWEEDFAATGNAFAEILRTDDGFIWEHLPSSSMLLTRPDRREIVVDLKQRGADGEVVEREVPMCFRRYVQVLEDGRRIWFKELGDPRPMRHKSGYYLRSTGEGDDGDQNYPDIPEDELASEVIHFARYNPLSPYGLPEWIGVWPQIEGERAAQKSNEGFFSADAIPRIIVLLSGGQLTEESFEATVRAFREGAKNKNRILFLEAVSAGTSMDDKSNVKLDFKSLSESRIVDGQFQSYIKQCIDAVRQVVRLAPIYTGDAASYSFASSNTSKIVTEEQVFQPARDAFDELVNMRVLMQLEEPPKFWRYVSKGPEVADIPTYVSAIGAFLATGALTLNEAISLANEMLGTTMAKRTEPWADWPWQMVMSLLAQGKLTGMDEIEKAAPVMLPGMPGADGAGGDGTPGGFPEGRATESRDGSTKPPPAASPKPPAMPAVPTAAKAEAAFGELAAALASSGARPRGLRLRPGRR